MSTRLQQETLQFLIRAMEQKNRELSTTLGQFRREKVEAELKILSERFKIECGCEMPEFRPAA
jgi:hypothetical protein